MEEREIIVKNGSFGTLLSGFLIGGLIGATVALLAAPQSGAETRAMIGDKASEWRDRAVDMASDTRDRAGKMVSSARDQAVGVLNRSKDRANDIAQEGADTISQGS